MKNILIEYAETNFILPELDKDTSLIILDIKGYSVIKLVSVIESIRKTNLNPIILSISHPKFSFDKLYILMELLDQILLKNLENVLIDEINVGDWNKDLKILTSTILHNYLVKSNKVKHIINNIDYTQYGQISIKEIS